jgi:hypothetical protein
MDLKVRVLGHGARAVLAVERLLGRIGRPYAADGLIISARRPGEGRALER